jgi:hypothetical protein
VRLTELSNENESRALPSRSGMMGRWSRPVRAYRVKRLVCLGHCKGHKGGCLAKRLGVSGPIQGTQVGSLEQFEGKQTVDRS